MSGRDKRDAPGSVAGWWLMPGPAICLHCEQPHQIEAICHCVRCDAVICAVCVRVNHGGEGCCPVCHGGADEV